MRGKIIENYLLVPQFGGNYNIGPIKFSFFNPEEERYITLTSEPINLVVDGPKPPKEKLQTEDLNIADIQKIDSTESSDEILILPVSLNEVKDKVVSSVLHKHTWILVGFIVLTLLFVLLRKRSSTKTSKMSVKQENEIFKSKMKSKLVELKSFSKSGDAIGFYSLQETILTDLAMHYTETSLANFTENSIAEKISQKYNSDLAKRWNNLLLESKQVKYSPVFTQENLAQKMQEIETITLEFFSHK